MSSQLAARITTNPRVMGGKPCIRGMRVTVSTIKGLLRSGHDAKEILELYPCLEREDIDAVIEFDRGQLPGPGGAVEETEAQPGQSVSLAGAEAATSSESGWSPEARRVADAIRELPEPEQEYVLARIIASLEEEGGGAQGEVERLWRQLAQLEFSRVAGRLEKAELSTCGKASGSARAGDPQPRAGEDWKTEGTLVTVIRSRRYPFLVDGTVDGFPFCLLEEGDGWRFAVSRDVAVDPRTLRASCEGWVVGGRVAIDRVRGEPLPMTDEQLLGLIEVSRHILVRRVESGRAPDAPGLARAREEQGPGR